MSDLKEHVVVITGGSSGIGLAAAHLFARAEAHVVLFARDEAALVAARAGLPGDTLIVAGDVCRHQDLDNLMSAVRAHHGAIDHLFVNAGIAEFESAAEASPEHFDRLFATNVRGAFFTAQKALPLLRGGGSIVFNTSVANALGAPRTSVYGATKAALRSFTRTLAAELLPRGIRVNAVSPGPTETPIHAKYARTLTPEILNEMGRAVGPRMPMARMARAQEVAEAVVFLSSPRASFVLGQELAVDGGMTAL